MKSTIAFSSPSNCGQVDAGEWCMHAFQLTRAQMDGVQWQATIAGQIDRQTEKERRTVFKNSYLPMGSFSLTTKSR